MNENVQSQSGDDQPTPRLLFQRVQKRDGSVVDFNRDKIAAAIGKAMQAVGNGDRALADQLADRVIIRLAKTYEDKLLNIEEIQDAVETVLMEQGQSAVAKAYILYRNEHARKRAIRVRTRGASAEQSETLGAEVERSGGEVVTWNRDRIVDALVRETGLPRDAATKISGEVEEQLIYSRTNTITTDLIRELVNAKLVEHGYHHERTLHARLGVPMFDVERAITGGPSPPESTDLTLAGSILREYGLRRVLPADVVEAHLRGEISVTGLEQITRPCHLLLSPAYLLKFGLQLPHALAHARPARHSFTLVAHLVKATTALQGTLYRGVGWDAVDVIFAPLLAEAGDRELDQLAQTLVFDFSQQSEAQGGRPLSADIHLCGAVPARLRNVPALGPGGELLKTTYGDYEPTVRRFARALIRAFRQGDGRGHPFACPRLVAHISDDLLAGEEVDTYLDELLDLTATWGTPLLLFERDGMHRLENYAARSRSVVRYPWQIRAYAVSDVTLNLAQAALTAGGNDADLMHALTDLCRLGVKAHLARRAFLQRLLAQGEDGPLAMLCLTPDGDPLFQPEQATDMLSLMGLDELLLRWQGERLGRSGAASEPASRVLTTLAAECNRYAEMHGIRLVLSAATDAKLSIRTAVYDRRNYALDDDAPVYYTPAGQQDPAQLLEPEARIEAEAPFHPFLNGGAVTVVRSLPASADARIALLRHVHAATSCHALAVASDTTLCGRCGHAAKGRHDICPHCASAGVTGLTRLLGPLETVPRWAGPYGPLVSALP